MNFEDQEKAEVNNVRAELLKLTDDEMIKKLRDYNTKINSEAPRVINYCKENNFCIRFEENFCSSRVNFNEQSLFNVKISKDFKNVNKKRSTFGNFSSKFINRIPNIHPNVEKAINNNFTENYSKKRKSSDWMLTSNFFTSNKNIYFMNQLKDVKAVDKSPDSPSIRKLKQMRKKNLSKSAVFHGTAEELIIGRNNAGAYLENEDVFLRIKDSFIYIRSLPYLQKSFNVQKTPEKKRQEQQQIIKELEELEESLYLKDGVDEKDATKKLNKIKENTKDIVGRGTSRLKTIKENYITKLSPIIKNFNKKRSSKGSGMFLFDLKSAHDINFKLDLNDLGNFDDKGLLTHEDRKPSGSEFDLDLNSSGTTSEKGHNDIESNSFVKTTQPFTHELECGVEEAEESYDDLNKTIN